jgi:hypothetical protein
MTNEMYLDTQISDHGRCMVSTSKYLTREQQVYKQKSAHMHGSLQTNFGGLIVGRIMNSNYLPSGLLSLRVRRPSAKEQDALK